MKVLLFGGVGQLGSEIRQRWSADVIAPTHGEADIANPAAVRNVVEPTYDLVINCAAFHNVDACERQPDEAFRMNSAAVGDISAVCAERGVDFLTISTDYVFDGEANEPYPEDACPRPVQTYGASKLAGEHLALRQDRAYVVRTCGLYGVRTSTTKGYTFIDRVMTQLRSGETPTVVSDVTVSPTYAGHLAEALWELVQTKKFGLYHAVNTGAVSWFDFASEAARQAGIRESIEPISSSQWRATARRPRYSALANVALTAHGITMPDWRDGISAYLRDKAAAETSA